ncbi:MAG: DUF4129 domain-containing protein [Propionibacteriaceae bacterium]|nr:DUF4129 domain-containing protein [Propionibacteriaceae bacterium]
MTPLAPPLTPTADEARRQLEEELAKPEYLDPGSRLSQLWEDFLRWLLGGNTGPSTTSPTTVWVVVAVVLVLALLVALAVAGPLRPERLKRKNQALFDGDERDSATIRADAEALAQASRWPEAIAMRFRAVIRSLSEAGLLQESRGMTAREAAEQASWKVERSRELLEAAALFDQVAYGRRAGSEAQYRWISDLDAALNGVSA